VNGAPALGLKVTADIKSANPAQAADSGLAHAYGRAIEAEAHLR